ncbi:Phosphatidylinositol (PI) 3-kinase, partial [Spiromyces aspiralis]
AELRHGATGSEGDNGSDVEFQDDEPLPAASAPNLCVSIQISADELPLCLPVQTSSQHASGDAKTWDQILEFPVKYRDLPPDTQLTIAVLKLCGTGTSAIVGGHGIPIDPCSKLRQGSQRLKLWRGRLPDRSFPTTTPGKPTDPNEVDRLCKLVKKYDQRSIHRLPWLDRLAFEKIHKIKHEHDLYSDGLHLLIELPTFDFPLIFSEK